MIYIYIYLWSIYDLYISDLWWSMYVLFFVSYCLCDLHAWTTWKGRVNVWFYLYGRKTTPSPLTLPSKQLFSSRICIWSSAWQFWWQWHRWHQPWSLPFEVPGVTTRFTRQWGRYIWGMYRTEKFHMIWELSQVYHCMYQSFKQVFFQLLNVLLFCH